MTGIRRVSDLGTNGAAAIVDGSIVNADINASAAIAQSKVANLTTSLSTAGGLVYIKSVTVGSGVSSVSVTDAFSTTYDSYMITWTGGVCNVSAEVVRLQLTGATGSNYSTNLLYSLAGTPNTPLAAGTTSTSFLYAGGGNSSMGLMSVHLHNPFLAKPTVLLGSTYNLDTAFGHVVGKHSLSTSYTGFTFLPETSTITGGVISVYGYRKSIL